MKCDCGYRCDLINTRVIVDTIEKEYYCLKCSENFFMIKDSKGTHTVRDRNGSTLQSWTVKYD